MANIKWENGAICFAFNHQWRIGDVIGDGSGGVRPVNDDVLTSMIDKIDFQLNEIRQGDCIESSELDTEQKYNDVVEVFGLEKSMISYERHINEYQCEKFVLIGGIFTSVAGDDTIEHYCKRELTYPQLMAIGKLKRAMIERDEVQKIDHKNTWVNPEYAASDWSDKHYNYFYQLTKEDIERGEVKVDAYFVNRMWKINSWEDTGAGFHILKTLPRIANNKNSLKRELVALKKQVDTLCKLHGVDDDTTN